MARGETNARAGEAKPSLPVEVPRLTVEEGRTALHSYVKEFRGLTKPSASLLDRAVEVGPRRQGGLLLVPEIDALAAVNRLDEVERENDELLDELEAVGIALLAEARLAEPTPAEQLIPIEELARKHGFAELLGE
jgi:hypothetical protein